MIITRQKFRFPPLNDLRLNLIGPFEKPGKDGETILSWEIRLQEDQTKFCLLQTSGNGDWTVRFKTISDVGNREKLRIYQAISRLIPHGNTLGSWGTVSKEGIEDLEKLKEFGFEVTGSKPGILRETKEEIKIVTLRRL